MNDQVFVNTYIKILNDTLTEAINKNIVLQAQLEVSKSSAAKVPELENKIRELNSTSVDVSSLKEQLNQTNAQLASKNGHVETFKRELVDARNLIKSLNAEHASKVASLESEIESLKQKLVELNSKKRKNKSTLNTLAVLPTESNSILVSETF